MEEPLGWRTLGAGLGGKGGRSIRRSATRWPTGAGPGASEAASRAVVLLLLLEAVEEVDGVAVVMVVVVMGGAGSGCCGCGEGCR